MSNFKKPSMERLRKEIEKNRDTKGSSKWSKPAPTKKQREQKAKAESYKSVAEAIWKQGKGGS
tara:strand:- start:348 stop:536 length:189 start_codon:yes stop_codon:yes gene_type:complete